MDKNLLLLYQLGRRIAYLRKQRHMSQLTLSIRSGVAKSYLSELERGKRNPTISVLYRLANTLHITLEELLKGVDREISHS